MAVSPNIVRDDQASHSTVPCTPNEKVAMAKTYVSSVDDQGNGTGPEQRLYQLIRQPMPSADRQFEIEVFDSGVEAFACTFG